MRLHSPDTIAGRPALETRRLLRDLAWHEPFTRDAVARWQDLTPRQAARRLNALAAEGYLERDGTTGRGEPRWALTRKGHALRIASANKPITRATAERIVAGVLERARALADWEAHPYAKRVAELVVFGSYLRDVDRLGDVDLAVLWEPRHADRSVQYAYARWRTAEAHAAGRTFRNYSDELLWPEVEVVRYLKGRSPAVSLCDLSENGEFVRSVPHRVVWHYRAHGVHAAEG